MADLTQGLALLTALSDPRRPDHAAAVAALPTVVSQASFVTLMLQILSTTAVSVELRQMAGMLVKNYSVSVFAQGTSSSSATPSNSPLLSALHAALVAGLMDPAVEVRKAAASLLGKVVDSYTHPYWAPVVPHLTQVLRAHLPRSPDDASEKGSPIEALDGALTAIVVLCEDAAEKLNMDAARPLEQIVPLLLGLLQHPHEPARHYSLTALNALVYDSQSGPLYMHLPTFVSGLGALCADPSARVRRAVCQALILLISAHAQAVQPCFEEVCAFMLASVLDQDEAVAIEACEFWLTLLGEPLAHAALQAKLPLLVPNCMARLRLTQAQVEREREEEEAQASGSEKIRFSAPRGRRGGDDDNGSYTIRKQSAFLLDNLAVAFPRGVLATAAPCITGYLQSPTPHSSWDREAGMLALGAIATGCGTLLKESLTVVWPALMSSLQDELQETRAMACWCMSRYAGWIDEQLAEGSGEVLLRDLAQGLCGALLDTQPRVQSAACSALSSLVGGVSPHSLHNYLDPMLQRTHEAWGRYGLKNRLLLMDTWSELADAMGDELGKRPHLTPLYLPHITAFLQEHSLNPSEADTDADMLAIPALECLGSFFAALPQELAPIATDCLRLCLQLLDSYQQSEKNAQRLAEEKDSEDSHTYARDVAVCCLDLLASMAQGLSGSFPLLMQSRLSDSSPDTAGDLLIKALGVSLLDGNFNVKTAALALVGEAAVLYPQAFLAPEAAGHIFSAILRCLDQDPATVCDDEQPDLEACRNNAVWSAGLCLEALGTQSGPFLPSVLHRCVQLHHELDALRDREGGEMLRFNLCVLLARLRGLDPAAVGLALPEIMPAYYFNLLFVDDRPEGEAMVAWSGLLQALVCDPTLVMASRDLQEGFMRSAERVCMHVERSDPDLGTLWRIVDSIRQQSSSSNSQPH